MTKKPNKPKTRWTREEVSLLCDQDFWSILLAAANASFDPEHRLHLKAFPPTSDIGVTLAQFTASRFNYILSQELRRRLGLEYHPMGKLYPSDKPLVVRLLERRIQDLEEQRNKVTPLGKALIDIRLEECKWLYTELLTNE